MNVLHFSGLFVCVCLHPFVPVLVQATPNTQVGRVFCSLPMDGMQSIPVISDDSIYSGHREAPPRVMCALGDLWQSLWKTVACAMENKTEMTVRVNNRIDRYRYR